MAGRSPKEARPFSRTTASIVAGNGEAAPSSNPFEQAGAFFVEPCACVAIGVKCSTHTTFDVQFWGALSDSGSWFKINNGSFTTQSNFVEEISCAALKYMFVQIADTVGAGSEAYTVEGRGVVRKEVS